MRLVTTTTFMLVVFASLAGCQDSGESPQVPATDLEGVYAGEYTRIDGCSGTAPATTSGRVRLVVDGDRYEIEGAERLAPPSGRGSIAVGRVVTLDDEGMHTADFDWTLILEGDFNVVREGPLVVLEQYDGARDRLVRLELEPDPDGKAAF
jgi:hypothetical protein